MKIFQMLEQTFKYRITSNKEIPVYMKRISQAGKFDEPKKNALITEILLRLAEIEDQDAVTKLNKSSEEISQSDLSWKDLQKKGKELGIYKVGQTKDELKALIQAQS